MGHECDLALLDVDDSGFWDNLPSLQFGSKPPDLLESVSVIGYPVGGDRYTSHDSLLSMKSFTFIGA